MRSQQFTTISPRTGSSVPYGKPSRPGVFSRTLPWLFGTFGVLLIATAGTTALMPELPAAAEPVLDVLDRAGLDKGPLAMFGLLTLAVAFAMRPSRSGAAATSAAPAIQEREFRGLEERVRETGEALEAARNEIGALRQELNTGFEAARSASATADEAGNDRIFRLAASLDQLGAQVDRRMTQMQQGLETAIETAAAATRAAHEQSVRDLTLQGAAPAETASPAAGETTGDGDASTPIYGDDPKQAMASFMADLRSLPQDLLDTAEELAVGGDALEELKQDDGLRLIDRMEDDAAEPEGDPVPPLFPEMGQGEAS